MPTKSRKAQTIQPIRSSSRRTDPAISSPPGPLTSTIQPKIRALAASASRPFRTRVCSIRSEWKHSTTNRCNIRLISSHGLMTTASRSSPGSIRPGCTFIPISSRSQQASPDWGVEADGMVEADGHIGQLLQQLDDLGIANNTIVIYTTDNGAEVFSWPEGGTTPFRGEKHSNWEGAYRIPMMVRWPGQIAAGSISNGIFSLQDWLPTLLAAAGVP